MLNSSRIVAFVATENPPRAKAFYQDVLQLTLVSDDAFATVFDANGTMLRVSKVTQVIVAPYTVLGWGVKDIGAAMKDLIGRGVTFEIYKGLPQDERGVCTFPSGAKVAWFKDPDGNTLSMTEFARSDA
jgi:predicted enzyme related to lactoylglutathione lyase